MNFSSMDYFIMVARERSFTRAAERLHITQQTLSAHIAALEKELGVKLLVRNIPLELTYGGEVFLEYALDFQQRVSALEHEFQDISHNQRGLLRIGIAYTRGDIVMPPLLTRFRTMYPKISIRLMGAVNDSFLPLVENGELDIAIGSTFFTALPGIELIDFYQEEMILAVSREIVDRLGLDSRPEELAKIGRGDLSPLQECPFLLSTTDDITGKVGYNLLHQSGFVPIPAVESHNSTVKTQLVLCANGAGACFSPKNMLATTLTPSERERLRIFSLGDEARYMVRLAYQKQSYHWSVITDFIRLALEMSDSFITGESCTAAILRQHPAHTP